jgi:protein tyrosine phosphatase (PTP) superfamily phosphohydrolase (DUF442 family)
MTQGHKDWLRHANRTPGQPARARNSANNGDVVITREQESQSLEHAGRSELGDEVGDVKTITEREFCARVGISVSTALALRKNNKLAHCRVGRRVLYIYPRHVEEFLARMERKPKAA